MVDIPDDSRGSINEAFAERLERIDPEFSNVIIEAKDGRAQEVIDALSGFSGVDINTRNISAGVFIPATVPENSIPDIARIDAVALVHQDQLTGITELFPNVKDFPALTPENDPIRTKASEWVFNAFTPEDQYLGRHGIDEVEMPRFNFAQLPPGDPAQTAFTALDKITGANTDGTKHIPTSTSVDWLLDGSVLSASDSGTSQVAVLDTGHTPLPDTNGARIPYLGSKVPGELPLDGLAHGSWCTNTVAASSAPSIHGRTQGVAPQANYAHVKCLNNFPGVGRTSWILSAMDEALSWGADVISMSLGGTQQGPVGQDPYVRYIDRNCKENAGDDDGAIFVVAAGNAGPDSYTIGSPGVAPKALTVGSWSLSDASPAVFSSRGPQGGWYASHNEKFQSDLDAYDTDEFVKPDVAAPGGGRENQAKTDNEDELLHQVATGWMEGLYDGFRDMRASMKGTSMACPHVAGLVYRLYDEGLVDTASDVKDMVASEATVTGYPQAAAGANDEVAAKNISVGFGPIKESHWG